MSLTQGAAVFGSIHEDALNDLLRAFFNARPRYRNFGSPSFAPSTTAAVTQMSAIAFPGVPGGGIQWSVSFDIPTVDLFQQTAPLPPEIVIGPGQFALSTKVHLCVLCSHHRGNDNPDGPTGGKPTCADIGVSALGHLESRVDGSGNGEVRLRLDQVELVDIRPDDVESLLECLIRMILDAALDAVALPLQALRAGAFNVAVTSGPQIDDDQIKVFGNFIP
jgi:hypothetical protein